MTTPPSGRRSSSSSSRHRSSSANGGVGGWEPELAQTEADFDFCNAFWVTPPNARQRGQGGREGEEEDWGRGGVETVLGRMKMGTKGLEDLRGFYRERATMEDDYAKKLNKLSRHGFGAGETGHLDRAILQTKGECDAMAKAHTDLANLMRTQETQVNDFLNKREGARKSQQINIEKRWKDLNTCRHHVLKAKDKYEQDAISINSLHASASLLQGRDLDKATMKLDKAQQTVVVNEKDYKQYTQVLKENTGTWNMAWKAFCDLCQDQEEERLEFVKGRLWDWANALSTVAMSEDESAERTRTALEQCEPQTDIKLFVSATGTGNSIPDPLPFVDFSKGGAPSKQGYKLARYSRSSTRMPGVKHSPSAVDDIARAFHQPPQAQPRPTSQQAPPPPPQQQQQDPRARHNSQGAQRQSQQDLPPSASTQSIPSSAPRPQSRGANRPPSRGETLAAPTLSSAPSADLSPSQETTPTRPKMAESASAGRFAVSPSANLRGSSERIPSSSSAASGIGLGKPGHISAGAFQRGSMSPSPSFGMAEGGGTSPKPAPYEAPIPQPESQTVKQMEATAPVDEENDPLAQALRTLQASSSSPRTGGFPGAVGLPGMTGQDGGARPTHRQSQQSLGRAAGAAFGAQGSTSRPSSPAPQAAMMQPPPSHPSSSNSRPSSRQGSVPPPQHQQQQQQQRFSHHSQLSYSASNSQVGIGARGRSPSPQPFNHPEALRPHSPNPGGANPPRSSSPQPGGGASGFVGGHQKMPSLGAPVGGYGAGAGGRPQSQQMGRAPSPGPQGQFARAPSPGPQQGYGRAPSPSPQAQQQGYGRAPSPSPQAQQPYGRAPSPSPHQQYRSPSPAPQHPNHQQHSSITSPYGQAPSQHFQSPPPPQQQLHHTASQHFQQHPAGMASPASSVSAYAPSPSLVGMQSPYQQSAPSSIIGSPAPYQQQQPQPHQPFRHPSAAAPPPSLAAPGPNGAPYNAAQIPTQQQMGVHRSGSMHSGASSAVSASQAYGGVQMQAPYQQQQGQQGQFQQPPQQQQYAQPPPQHQAQQQPTPAPAQRPAGPPTGQYTDEGKAIMFYVNAIYDYAASSAEEFSFAQGDVIAVTDTDPDGWWKGNKVGVSGGDKLFPSNFTELLS